MSAHLYHQVQVVRLDRVFDHAQVAGRAGAQRTKDARVLRLCAQAAKPRRDAQRDEHWMVPRQPRPPVVRHARALALRLASRAAPPAAPVHEPELSLRALLHAHEEHGPYESFAPFVFSPAPLDSARFSSSLRSTPLLPPRETARGPDACIADGRPADLRLGDLTPVSK